MVILLFGPPGSGKGTQSRRIAEWSGIPVFSTGDMLRAEAESGSQLGQRLATILSDGGYAEDSIVNSLVEKQLDMNAASGVILDGYPRTLDQVNFLEQAFAARQIEGPAVVKLAVPTELVVERLAARRHCPSCGRTYHLSQNPPPVPGTCACGRELIRRSDDYPEVITRRLEAYDRLTAPVLAHYAARSRKVDGTGSPDEVFRRIRDVLETSLSRPAPSAAPGSG